MLKKYGQFLKELLQSVLNSSDEPLSFGEYLQTIGMGLLLILALLFIAAVLTGMVVIPKLSYKKLVTTAYARLNEVLNSSQIDENEIRKAKRTVNIRRGIFAGIMMLYVPIAIPTVLYIADIVIFAFG